MSSVPSVELGVLGPEQRIWSVIAQGYASLNRREIPKTTAEFADVDHRTLAIGTGDLKAYLSAMFSDVARNTIYLESVHRLTDLGAVASHAASATSGDGFDAEWRMIGLFLVEGDLLARVEVFDDGDVGAALARFDELRGTT